MDESASATPVIHDWHFCLGESREEIIGKLMSMLASGDGNPRDISS